MSTECPGHSRPTYRASPVPTDEIARSVGARIREARARTDTTQNEVAEFLGISARDVQLYEAGTASPTVSHLFNMASFFGLGISFFMVGVGSEAEVEAQAPVACVREEDEQAG